MHAQGEHANSMQKDPWLGVKPRTFFANNCATVQSPPTPHTHTHTREGKCWTRRPGSQPLLQFIPKVFYQVEIRTVQTSQAHPHQTLSSIYLSTLLCALVPFYKSRHHNPTLCMT
ncbi:hypothetical protein GOODEAATRI_033508 [Goodea atripinnis]|uniref:Uncharacterized protein n=1 Tax=Goodea atripinnis TaxID=208336 RepID=A0ABV0Q3X2_9TELE